MKFLSAIFMGFVVIAGVSCKILEPKEDPSRYYRLRSVAFENGGQVIESVDEKVAISIGPAVIPSYLDRQRRKFSGCRFYFFKSFASIHYYRLKVVE